MAKFFTISNLFIIFFSVLTAILGLGLMACYWSRGWLSISSAANLASIFASVAVGISLLFIATQLRQQNKLARASNSQSFVNASSDFVLEIASDCQLMKLYATGGARFEQLTADEQAQYSYLVSWWLTFYENVVYQRDCELLDEGVYAAWILKDMKGFILRRRVEKVWESLKENYSDEFKKEIQPLIDDRESELKKVVANRAYWYP
jgi:hypothetical protein